MRYAIQPSPLGPLILVADGPALVGLYLGQSPARIAADWVLDDRADPLAAATAQLAAYFAGELTQFELPLRPQGTPFQQRVWTALRTIPYGSTLSYGALAQRIGHPQAARAVGLANGRNPLSIVVPCHRVIGAKGELTGYSGGVERKRWLLAHEQATPNQAATQLALL